MHSCGQQCVTCDLLFGDTQVIAEVVLKLDVLISESDMKRNIVERAGYSPSNPRFTDVQWIRREGWLALLRSVKARLDATRGEMFWLFRVALSGVNHAQTSRRRHGHFRIWSVPSRALCPDQSRFTPRKPYAKRDTRCVYPRDTRVSRRRERTHSTVKKLFAFMASRESIVEQGGKCLSSILPYATRHGRAEFRSKTEYYTVEKRYRHFGCLNHPLHD